MVLYKAVLLFQILHSLADWPLRELSCQSAQMMPNKVDLVIVLETKTYPISFTF